MVKKKKVKERSHVVTSGKMGKRKFKKAVKKLGKKVWAGFRIDTNEKNWYTISNKKRWTWQIKKH